MNDEVLFGLRVAAYLFGLAAAVIGMMAAYLRFTTWRKRKVLAEDELSARFLRQFNTKEIDKALSGYVIPHCSPADPSNREGEEFLADTREQIFSYMDRNVEVVERSFHLLLADTGMGKTTFGVYPLYIRKRVGYIMTYEQETPHHRAVLSPVS